MNVQANAIIKGMQAMAKGKCDGLGTSVTTWLNFRCAWFPSSKRFAWYYGTKDITNTLTQVELLAMVKTELERIRDNS